MAETHNEELLLLVNWWKVFAARGLTELVPNSLVCGQMTQISSCTDNKICTEMHQILIKIQEDNEILFSFVSHPLLGGATLPRHKMAACKNMS